MQLLARGAAGVQHARYGLQGNRLRKVVYGSPAAIIRRQTGNCGWCMKASGSSTQAPLWGGRATNLAMRPTNSCSCVARVVAHHTRHDLLGDVEAADMGEGTQPPLPHHRMQGVETRSIYGRYR